MSKDICKEFAKKLTELRKAKKMTKTRLSELAGIDMSYIGKIERCEKSPTLTTIGKLAEALEVQPKELFDFALK